MTKEVIRMRKLIPKQRAGALMRRERDANPFDLLRQEFNDLFDTGFRDLGKRFGWPGADAGFELSETDDEICVKAELPGMDEKDIDVSLDENILTIRGEKKEQSEKKKRKIHVSEMSYGSFHRSFPLPVEVEASQARAKFKRGVLTLTFPKTERVKEERKRIPIECG
jgi:HSP20 family protein